MLKSYIKKYETKKRDEILQDYRNLKRKLFWYHYPTVDYKWITWVKKFGGWIEYEEYKRLKREEKKSK